LSALHCGKEEKKKAEGCAKEIRMGGDAGDGVAPMCTSVDDVQARIDALMLSLFEAVRGHEAVTAETSVEARGAVSAQLQQTVADNYAATLRSVQNLVGLNRTSKEQEDEIASLAEQCEQVRQRILQREDKLVQRREDIDTQLKELLNDQVLGLSRS
jgi:hypothetical protein